MRRLIGGVAVVGGALGVLIGTAAPAVGAPIPIPAVCDFREYCVFEHANGSGGIYTTAGSVADYNLRQVFYNQTTGDITRVYINDAVTSYRNNGENAGATVVHSYRHSHSREELWSTPIGGVHNVPGWANDQASSHNWQRS